jgi:hypothetical protein
VRPFLLQDRDEYEVQLVEEGTVGLEGLFGVGALKDVLDDEVADSCCLSATCPASTADMHAGAYLDIAPAAGPSTLS